MLKCMSADGKRASGVVQSSPLTLTPSPLTAAQPGAPRRRGDSRTEGVKETESRRGKYPGAGPWRIYLSTGPTGCVGTAGCSSSSKTSSLPDPGESSAVGLGGVVCLE